MNAEQRAQFDIIRELTELLQAGRIPHWLFGGWAIDFIVGEVTRPHDDIEFAIWADDAERVRDLISPRGYRLDPDHTTEDMWLYWHGDLFVEFYNNIQTVSGQTVIAGKWRGWPWVEGAFDAPPATLMGITCPVVSAHSIFATKEGYASQPNGGPLREKDVADIARLRQFLTKKIT